MNRPAVRNNTVSRSQVIQACEALGVDPEQVHSIHIEATEIKIILPNEDQHVECWTVLKVI